MEKTLQEQSPYLIELQDVRKVYPVQGGEVVALNDINLKIRRGEIYGIIGLSGAGQEHADPLREPVGYAHGRAVF